MKCLAIHALPLDIVPANIRPSFHLRTLMLGSNAGALSATLTQALLAASFSSLLSLTLVSIEPTCPPSLSLIANSVTSLSLHNPIPGLGPPLSSFTALSHLTLHISNDKDVPEYDNLLSTWSSSTMESLTIVLVYDFLKEEEREFVQAFAGKAWARVTEVVIAFQSPGGPAGALERFLELCETKGITVRRGC